MYNSCRIILTEESQDMPSNVREPTFSKLYLHFYGAILLHGAVLPEYDVCPSVRPSVRCNGDGL